MKKYLVIGNPIEHSLSPKLHNYWIKENNIEAIYEKKKLDNSEIKEVINEMKNDKVKGINVTLPYKQKIIPFVDQLVNDAKSTNSVNTIFLDDSKSLVGENTDVFGLQAAYLKEITNTKNKKALIIGAGGVSPSVIFSLQKSKIKNIKLNVHLIFIYLTKI